MVAGEIGLCFFSNRHIPGRQHLPCENWISESRGSSGNRNGNDHKKINENGLLKKFFTDHFQLENMSELTYYENSFE